jgi:hypothetical protein
MTSKRKSWRDVITVHPAADLFPMMSEAELRDLAQDIKQHGLKNDIVIYSKGSKLWLLDGRNRLDAMEANGSHLVNDDGTFNYSQVTFNHRLRYEYQYEGKIDPYAYVISANIHRRHLTAEQKQKLLDKLLTLDPSKSDRAIAKAAKVDKNTVAKVRKEKEGRGEIHHVAKRTDTKGRKQPAIKKKVAPKVEPKTEPTEPKPAAWVEPMPKPQAKVQPKPVPVVEGDADEGSPEQRWEQSVNYRVEEAIEMEMLWTREHGAAWRDFPVSSQLAASVREAAEAWRSLADQLDARIAAATPASVPAAAPVAAESEPEPVAAHPTGNGSCGANPFVPPAGEQVMSR